MAFVADSVAVESGKIYAQGIGWDNLGGAEFPLRHDRVGVGVVIEVPYTATNQDHEMILRLEDADGEIIPLGDAPAEANLDDDKIRKFGARFTLGRPPNLAPGAEQNVVIALNLDGLSFPHPGRYRFVVEIDGSEESYMPFRVFSTQPQVQPLG
jgi:hypothetical protein